MYCQFFPGCWRRVQPAHRRAGVGTIVNQLMPTIPMSVRVRSHGVQSRRMPLDNHRQSSRRQRSLSRARGLPPSLLLLHNQKRSRPPTNKDRRTGRPGSLGLIVWEVIAVLAPNIGRDTAVFQTPDRVALLRHQLVPIGPQGASRRNGNSQARTCDERRSQTTV